MQHQIQPCHLQSLSLAREPNSGLRPYGRPTALAHQIKEWARAIPAGLQSKASRSNADSRRSGIPDSISQIALQQWLPACHCLLCLREAAGREIPGRQRSIKR